MGAPREDSCATGIDGDETNNLCSGAEAAYVFAIVLDQDNDGVPDDVDNCPTVPNPGQEQTGNNVGGPFGDACVDPSVDIPAKADVDPTVLDRDVELMENTMVGSNVTIGKKTIVGEGAVIGDNSQIGKDTTTLVRTPTLDQPAADPVRTRMWRPIGL